MTWQSRGWVALATVLGHTLLVWGLSVLWGKSARPRWVLAKRTSMTVVLLQPLALTSRAPVPPLANKAAAHPVSAHANSPKPKPSAVGVPAAQGLVSTTPDVTSPAPVSQSSLNLSLREALNNAPVQRAPDNLGRLLDARRPRAGPSTVERAFASLSAEDGALLSDTVMPDGSRLVKFSGGTCMRLPNPAAGGFDRSVKPLPYPC